MNAYTITLIFICGAAGHCRAFDDYGPNVGTVLFSASDLAKDRWYKTDVAVLEARRYFQSLLPPPNFLNPNKDFVDNLINYFREAYSSIQIEATTPEVDRIMTTALSDTIGGYLKLWLLPVTKFAYYGGAITHDNVHKLFNLYNEVKEYLGTDGDAWRTPDDTVLKAITVSVPRKLHVSFTRRSMTDDPCEYFAYFEKTPNGFTIPIPHVNWDEGTMFLPLKNESLIALRSPKHQNTLLKYYDVAKTCLKTRSPNATKEFDDKFQTWLSNDVVLHLADENLYVALGSVLSLVNRSTLYDTFDTFDVLASCKVKSFITTITDFLYSKKISIVGVILVIELFWCILALQHISLRRTYEAPASCCNIFSVFKAQRKPSYSRRNNNDGEQEMMGSERRSSSTTRRGSKGPYINQSGGGVKFFQIPQVPTKCKATETYLPAGITYTHQYSVGTDTHSYICSSEIVNIVDESPILVKKSSLKKVTQIGSGKIKLNEPDAICDTFICGVEHQSSNCKDDDKKQDDNVAPKELEPGKIATILRTCQQNIEKAIITTQNNAALLRQSICEQQETKYILNVRPDAPSNSDCACTCCKDYSSCICAESNSQAKGEAAPVGSECACVCCTDDSECTCTPSQENIKPMKDSKAISTTGSCTQRTSVGVTSQPQNTEALTQTIVMCVDKHTETKFQKAVRLQLQKREDKVNVTKNREVKKRSKGYLAIKIDRPDTEISVGISGIRMKTDESPRQGVKESRIPKRALISQKPAEAICKPSKDDKPSTAAWKYKSLIPQLRKRTTDDIVVKSTKKATMKDSKLNLTL